MEIWFNKLGMYFLLSSLTSGRASYKILKENQIIIHTIVDLCQKAK